MNRKLNKETSARLLPITVQALLTGFEFNNLKLKLMLTEKQMLLDFLKFHYRENPYRKGANDEQEVDMFLSRQNSGNTHVMRPLLDEIENVSRAAQQKLVKHAQRPLSEGAIEAKAVIQVCEHLLGFILSNIA